jgi:hypothetical protein
MTIDNPIAPSPETAGGAAQPTKRTETWRDIGSDEFAMLCEMAKRKGGTVETNARASDFLYYGINEIAGRKIPRLIAVRHARVDGATAQKCRANIAAVEELGS